MRLLLAFLLIASASAEMLSNQVKVFNISGGTLTNRPVTHPVSFADGMIADYPAPYTVGGAAITPWQADRIYRWPSGYVRWAIVSYTVSSVADTAAYSVEFKNSTDPCSSGNAAACSTAGRDRSEMLTYNSSNWDAEIQVSGWPSGGTTRTFNARTVLGDSDGRCEVWLQGPVVTQMVCGLVTGDAHAAWDTTREYAFGWRNSRAAGMITGSFNTGDTTMNVITTAGTPSTPFEVYIEDSGEVVRICNKTATTYTIGTGSWGCSPDTGGRAQRGTSQGLAYGGTGLGQPIWIYDHAGLRIVDSRGNASNGNQANVGGINNYTTAVTFADASTITDTTTIFAGGAYMRPAGKSGNEVFLHHSASWGATSGQSFGQSGYGGILRLYNQNGVTIPAYKSTDLVWEDAPEDRQKSISPFVVLTAYEGFASMGHDWALLNSWPDRFQNQWVTVVVKGGPAGSMSTIETITGAAMVPKTMLQFPSGPNRGKFDSVVAERKYWTGTKPGAVRYGLNSTMFMHSGLVPLRPNIPSQSAITNTIGSGVVAHSNGNTPGWDHAQNTKCAAPNTGTTGAQFGTQEHWGPHFRDQGASGQRPEIGAFQFAQAATIANMDQDVGALTNVDRIWEMFHGYSVCSNYFPIHIRESSTSSSLKLCSSCSTFNTTNAFGFMPTAAARPTLALVNVSYNTNQAPFYIYGFPNPYSNATLTAAQGDTTGHMATLIAPHWWLTGDYIEYFKAESLVHWGSLSQMDRSTPTSGHPQSRQTGRNGVFGLIEPGNGPRTTGWGIRNAIVATAVLLPGTPERAAADWHVANLLAAEEGFYAVRDGLYYPGSDTCASPLSNLWCIGWALKAGRDDNVGKMNHRDFQGSYSVNETLSNPLRSWAGGAPWSTEFVSLALGLGKVLGIPGAARLSKAAAEFRTQIGGNPGLRSHHGWYQVYATPEHPCNPQGVDQVGCSSQDVGIGAPQAFTSYKNFDLAAPIGQNWVVSNYLTPGGYFSPGERGVGDCLADRSCVALATISLAGPQTYSYSEPIGAGGSAVTGTVSTTKVKRNLEAARGMMTALADWPQFSVTSADWYQLAPTVSGNTVSFRRPAHEAECRWIKQAAANSWHSPSWTSITLAAGLAQSFNAGTLNNGDVVWVACGINIGKVTK